MTESAPEVFRLGSEEMDESDCGVPSVLAHRIVEFFPLALHDAEDVVTGTGYFQNFGETLREGVQANLDGHFWCFRYGLDYTFLSATYQSVQTLDGSANNTSDIALSGYPGVGGVITVHPGNRIPLIPKQTGKAYIDVQATSKLFFDFGMIANSSSYVRGNENNAYHPTGFITWALE